MNRPLFALLRLLLSLGVAGWAIRAVLNSAGADLALEFGRCRWGWVALALALNALAALISSYRWSLLLSLQQVTISQWEAFKLTMIGAFFNLFGLGGVGGDVFKAYYVRGHAGERKDEAMLSILVDRILGLLGLFVVALLALPWVWSDLLQSPARIQSMTGFVVLVALSGGGGVALVLSRDLWLPLSAKESMKKLGARLPSKLHRIAERLIRSLDLYRSRIGELCKALMLSALVHTAATLTAFSVGMAFHIDQVALRFYFLAVQVANTISAVPITPGGLGSRDLVLKEFLVHLGQGPDGCGLIAFGVSCIIVLWSLVGGLFFVWARRVGEVPPQLEVEDT